MYQTPATTPIEIVLNQSGRWKLQIRIDHAKNIDYKWNKIKHQQLTFVFGS